MSAPSPAEQSSFPHHLAALYKRGFTGRLEVAEDGADTSVLYFRRGRVVKVRRPDTLDALEVVLVQERLLPARAVADAARQAGANEVDLAAALARTGVADVVRAGLKMQLRRQLTRVFFAERPRLTAVPGEPPAGIADPQLGADVDPRLLLYAGIRAAYDDARLARELAPLAGARVRLIHAEPTFLRDAGLPDARDPAMVALRDQGIAITETWLRTPTDRKGTALKPLVLAAHCLDLVAINRQAPAAGGGRDLTPSPSPAYKRRRTGITGLNALEPATVVKMAEGFFKSGDIPRAERAFTLALGSDANNRRARAFLAWITFWKPDTDRARTLTDTTRIVREALKSDSQFAQGYYFLGVLMKQANDLESAGRSFKAALAADATLVDAERELRLLTMRRAKV